MRMLLLGVLVAVCLARDCRLEALTSPIETESISFASFRGSLSQKIPFCRPQVAPHRIITRVPEAATLSLIFKYNISTTPVGGVINIPVPYGINNQACDVAFSRVAYYLELTSYASGVVNWVYVSMDAFASSLDQIGVPHSPRVWRQPVTNLQVRASAPEYSLVTGDFPQGNIEFWPCRYGPENTAHVPLASNDLFDTGDDPQCSGKGYGSMQVHVLAPRNQTVFAFNGFGGEGSQTDVGIGTSPLYCSGNCSTDWTYANNSAAFEVAMLYVLVDPCASTALPPTIAANVPEADGMKLVYDLSLLDLDPLGQLNKTVPYTVRDDVCGIPISRIGYYLELQTLYGPVNWVFTSFDMPFSSLDQSGLPNADGAVFQFNLTNVLVRAWAPQFNITNTTASAPANATGIAGSLEFWNCAYNAFNQANIPGASNSVFDAGDAFNCSFHNGSMQVHTVGNPQQTVFAVNNWALNTFEAGIGTNSGPVGLPDWTNAFNGKSYVRARLYVLAQRATTWASCPVTALTTPVTVQALVDEAQDMMLLYSYDLAANKLLGLYNISVPYFVHNLACLSGQPFTRVAYYLELLNSTALGGWVFTSFTPWSQQLSEYGIPNTETIYHRFITSVNVYAKTSTFMVTTGKNLGGNVEFWSWNADRPNAYGVPGALDNRYDMGDNVTGAAGGYGSMQVHTTDPALQTVFSINRFAIPSAGFSYDVGIGNQTALGCQVASRSASDCNPDWTYAYNLDYFPTATLHVMVQFCTAAQLAAPATLLANVAEAANFKLVYKFDVHSTPPAGIKGTLAPYAINNAACQAPFSRVAYYMEIVKSGVLNWVFVSFDPVTQDYLRIGLPTTGDYQTRVTNMNIYGVAPDYVLQSGTGLNGNMEFWQGTYGFDNTLHIEGASDFSFDEGDRPLPGFFGSMQIHSAPPVFQTVLAFNKWADSNPTDVGIGNHTVGHGDWTFAQNSAELDSALLYVLVLPSTLATPAPLASQSPSVTPSPSPTSSVSPSMTPSTSVTPSSSITPSPSDSSSVSASPSTSGTSSRSVTPTVSPSPSASANPSATASGSGSISAQSSHSGTRTETRTSTVSVTPSPSASESSSISLSVSPTMSVSSTPSLSITSSTTPSITGSSTGSITASTTPSQTPSTTASTTPSITSSITPSTTASATQSTSLSNTPSSTQSATSSPSPSVTPSASASVTSSTTPSVSASITPSTSVVSASTTLSASTTSSTTPSTSVSPTASITPSLSLTSSVSSTPSATPSVTPETTCGPLPQADVVLVLYRNVSANAVKSVRYLCLNAGAASPVEIEERCTLLGWSVAPADSCVATASCLGQGTWFVDGTCQDCPSGAFCPGGGVIWPRRGYWSPVEGEKPLACRNAQACLGAVGEVVPVVLLGATRKTDNCADGYTGPYCGLCDTGYYKSYDNCLACPPNATASLVSLVVAAVVLYTIMALGIAMLSDAHLDIFVSTLVTLQQLILLGRIASTRVANTAPWVAQAFAVLSVVTFDIQFARAECNTGPLTFVYVFWGTLLMMLAVGLLFLLASLGRAVFKKGNSEQGETKTPSGSVKTHDSEIDLPVLPSGSLSTGEQDRFVEMLVVDQDPDSTALPTAGTLWERFRRRGTRALLIFGTIMYLTVCTRVMQGLVCDWNGTQRILRVEPTTVCYEGAHTGAASMSWILLFAYCVGFPAAAFFALFRHYRSETLSDPEVSARWGYLYRGLRPRYFWVRLVTLLSTFVITITSATANTASQRIFAGCVLFELLGLLIILFWPFLLIRSNLLNLVSTGIKIVYAIAFLAVTDAQNTAFLSASYPLACIAAVAVAVRFLYRRVCALRCCARDGDDADADRDYNLEHVPVDDILLDEIEPRDVSMVDSLERTDGGPANGNNNIQDHNIHNTTATFDM